MAECSEVHMQSPVNCDTCEEDAAEHFCQTCHDKLCSRCKKIHNKSKATFDHEVVLLTSHALSLSNDTPPQQVCRSHAGFRANVCCSECEIPICEKCLLSEHNGHQVIGITDMFQTKMVKLEEKYSVIRSELPRYITKLHEVQERKTKVTENNDLAQKEIQSRMVIVKSKLDSQMMKLLEDMEENKKVVLVNLESQEGALEGHIKNMKRYINDYENKLPQEKTDFILFGNCALSSTMPEQFPNFAYPDLLKYESDAVDDAALKNLCGRLTVENVPRLKPIVKTLETIFIGNRYEGKTTSLAYQWQDDTFWLYSREKCFKIDRSANVLYTVNTNSKLYNKKPIAVTKKGKVIYRQDQCTLNEIDDYGLTYNYHASPGLAPLCLCARKDGGVIVGFLDVDLTDGGFFWLTEDGVVEKENRNIETWNKVYRGDIAGTRQPAYLAENVNGDICLSNKIVGVYTSDLQHRFSFKGLKSKGFLPYGICTNQYGHILITDGFSRGVHILSKDGDFLKLMNIPGLDGSCPIALTVDKNCSLCVGCSDGRIRVVEYLNV